jgi:hypothetical protein
MVKEIKLNRGFVALVDDEDYERVNQFKWHVVTYRGFRYAVHTINYPATKDNPKKTSKQILMHRFILDLKKGEICDHASGDGCDNRRSNTRKASYTENARNSKKCRGGTSSQFKGVCWATKSHKWWVVIEVDAKTVDLGYFNDEIEAAKTYNEAAKKYFGEFARLNIIPEDITPTPDSQQ